MSIAYITQSGTTLKKRGRKLVLYDRDIPVANIGMTDLDSIVFRGNIHLSTPAMKALLANGIDTAFLSSKGKLLGHLTAPKSGNVQLRLAQYKLQYDTVKRLQMAKGCVTDKLDAMLDILQHYANNYSDPLIKLSRKKLLEAREKISNAERPEQLLGMEGNASAIYWSVFGKLNRSLLGFNGRSRRPPRDEVNALLSLGYVILTNELRAMLEAMGFDPFLGFYHEVRTNRPGLALDMIEPFRHLIIDRIVLRLANLKRLKPHHFIASNGKGFQLDTSGWKLFLTEYEERMDSPPRGIMSETYPQAQNWRKLLQNHCWALRQTIEQPEPSCELATFF